MTAHVRHVASRIVPFHLRSGTCPKRPPLRSPLRPLRALSRSESFLVRRSNFRRLPLLKQDYLNEGVPVSACYSPLTAFRRFTLSFLA
jgi:hypothetical protein